LVQRILNQILSFMIFVGIVSTLVLVLDLKLYSRMVLFGTILFFFILRSVGFVLIYRYLAHMRAKGRHVKRVLILGAGRIGSQLLEHLNKDVGLGYMVVGFLDDAPEKAMVSEEKILGSISDLDSKIISENVDEIILAIPLVEEGKINKAIELAEFHGLRISMIPDYRRLFNRPFETQTMGSLPVINIREIALDNIFNKTVKRTFDILFSLIVLIVLTPLFIIIAIWVKLDSSGPILYGPVRIGQGGKEFKCWKFRSMKVDNSPDLASKSTVENDPRITKSGAFLRKQSLDELPQFFSVLIGNMSVIGPRPHRAFLNEDMQKKVDGYMLRHYIKPGISGWAQVNGWRGPTNTAEQKLERTTHDLWYVENWSLWLDVKIVFMTLFGSSKNAF
ncbi:MAG: undecaprenyl-phosphate glucose phosphotransferase, partial [Flavobacteriales bacterium]|nr:undecaprenyl-phosphate glucose phosphotransferase [Flavobacteriales bacterium]